MKDRTEKYCKRCDETLPIDKFTKSIGRYDGVQAYCAECMKKYRKEHYIGNKEAHYERNNKTRGELRDYVLELKNGLCVKCGVSYPGEPWLMEFDHRDPLEKEFNISEVITYGSKKKLQDEIDKCDLLCVICHRRKSASQMGWTLNRYLN